MHEIKLKINDAAPDFTLKNQNEKEIKLSNLQGKKILLSFHPLAWTPVCEIQMKTLEIKKTAFDNLNTVAFGISIDSIPCKKEWSEYLDIYYTDMLCDFWPHGEVAKKYGIFIEKAGISGRANFLIDEKGKIKFIKIYNIPDIPDIEEVLRAIKE